LANHNPKVLYEDITKIDLINLEKVNGIIAGFPCQSFSIAGKREGFSDTRGNLFFNLYEVLKRARPDFFILENVKGLLSHDAGMTFDTILTCLAKSVNSQHLFPAAESLNYNVHYQILNTKDYGIPQNRERVFIVGFKDEIAFKFPDKMRLKTRLKDLMESSVSGKYFIKNDNILKHIKKSPPEKRSQLDGDVAITQTARQFANWNGQYLNCVGSLEGFESSSRVYTLDMARCLKGSAGGGGAKTGLYCVALRTRNNKKVLERNGTENVNSITTTYTDSMLENEIGIRRLTPLECFRLQGFSDKFFYNCKKAGVSDTQLYKQAGNTITVNVLQAIFRQIIKSLNLSKAVA
jgi:DNA (cytosine-5)-methyltransferase 1